MTYLRIQDRIQDRIQNRVHDREQVRIQVGPFMVDGMKVYIRIQVGVCGLGQRQAALQLVINNE